MDKIKIATIILVISFILIATAFFINFSSDKNFNTVKVIDNLGGGNAQVQLSIEKTDINTLNN